DHAVVGEFFRDERAGADDAAAADLRAAEEEGIDAQPDVVSRIDGAGDVHPLAVLHVEDWVAVVGADAYPGGDHDVVPERDGRALDRRDVDVRGGRDVVTQEHRGVLTHADTGLERGDPGVAPDPALAV